MILALNQSRKMKDGANNFVVKTREELKVNGINTERIYPTMILSSWRRMIQSCKVLDGTFNFHPNNMNDGIFVEEPG